MTSNYSRLRLKKITSINSISVFHKEKEMADFRKWFFAFAVLALMLGASTAYAQIPGGSGSVICNLNPANPTVVSVENISALVGDYVLVCSGGTPTPVGQNIPQDNVTLTLNQNVTSRLLGGGYIDALLTIDEPYPTEGLGGTPNPPTAPQVVGSPTGQRRVLLGDRRSLQLARGLQRYTGFVESWDVPV